MKETISIAQFIQIIQQLPSDEPHIDPKKWYTTQKQHWLGWLSEYDGPGAYGRVPGQQRDARYAYNHIVEPKMLLWLIAAAGINPDLVNAARASAAGLATLQQQSAAIRKHVPWDEVANVLLSSGDTSSPKPNDPMNWLARGLRAVIRGNRSA